MPRYRLAIFDLDGTLIDSRPDIAAALNMALVDSGLPPRPETEIEPMIGDGARKLVERAISGRLPDGSIDVVLADYQRHYAAHRVVRTRCYPGVLDGLAALAAAPAVACAIATNKPGPLARDIAGDLGLSRFMTVVLGDGDVPRRKPEPDMLRAAMARAGSRSDETLYIGDGPVDVRTAAGAGVDLCLVGWGYRREETAEARPAYRARRFEEIVSIVRGE